MGDPPLNNHNVPLLVYIDKRLEDFGRQMDERDRAQREAVRVYGESNVRALEKVNEFRQSITDQNLRFASIDSIDGLASRLTSLEKAQATSEGRAFESETNAKKSFTWLGLGIAALTIILNILFRFV